MSPITRSAIATLALAASTFAQEDASHRLRSTTAPLRSAGVYHVATGTWTRGASLASATGPDVIYNNTCAPVYFIGLNECEKIQHRSRIPSTTGPTTPSVFYGSGVPGRRHDERPGCQDSYLVNGFQVAYCSSHVGTWNWRHEFTSSFLPEATQICGFDMVPQYTIDLTGLPGGTPAGAQLCWTVDIDLSGLPGGGMLLSADGDGDYDGPSTDDQFGWSFNQAGATASSFTGPIVAGDFTWTGGATTGPLVPCTGTDGTIWENPVHLAEEGTGMASNNFFRAAGTCIDLCWNPWDSCCFWFGGKPHADFHLRLFADTGCTPPDPMTAFCLPGAGGVRTCPCGNPPASSTVGCDNFGPNPPGGTGGARIGASGVASVADDTLEFEVTGEVESAGNLTVLWQGTTVLANGPPSGAQYGAGVRCVAGTLKRLYKGNAASGTIVFPSGAQPDVHTASAQKGYVIVPPITLHYFAAYRNSAAGTPCGSAAFGYNATNAGSVAWAP